MAKSLLNLPPDWKSLLSSETEKPYFRQLLDFLQQEYRQAVVYPPAGQIFNAFTLCPLARLKVVILGQDPYYNVGQAHGLAFSVAEGVVQPPSLRNIFKEISRDLGVSLSSGGNLTPWADQGVFLLNAVLTVREGAPLSHRNIGWERFTDEVIRLVGRQKKHVAFLLWGNHAISKRALIEGGDHLVLTAAHPSPLSATRGFVGCGHFSQANRYLQQTGQQPIDWRL
jgi:uracil-DNA glycosylase